MAYSRTPAPPELERLETFGNSARFLYEEEHLADPASARRWLREKGFPTKGLALDDDAVADLVRFREALRDHLDGDAPEATSVLNGYAERTLAAPRWDADGAPFLPVRGEGVDGLIGELLASAHTTATTGTLSRLKPCRAPECRWLFYDRSPAGNSIWCSMQMCGARHKMRTYRSHRA